MKIEKDFNLESNKKKIYRFGEMVHIKNRKIVPLIPLKQNTLLEHENEWQQEYNLIYNSYILEEDD